MARITVEDCLQQIPNRFSLVLVASERTKQILRGSAPLVETDDNKEAVTALREIAAGSFEIDDSAVIAEDTWKPLHRQHHDAEDDDELPPEA